MEQHATRRRVYVACRPIFSGHDSRVRRARKVKELVNNSKKSLEPLLRDFGEQTLINILRDLLEDRIFESELRAKVVFPELFRPSPLRDVQRQAVEVKAARSVAKALDEIATQDGQVPGERDAGGDRPKDGIGPEKLLVKNDRAEPVAGTCGFRSPVVT